MKILALDNVCKSFGGLQALCDISLEMKTGERRAIIGPNGAGKTTLFHTITGIYAPTSGAIYLFEENITRLPIHRRANLGISQTFQLINLFRGLTVIENTILAVQSFNAVNYTLYRPLSSYKPVIHDAEQLVAGWGFWEKRKAIVSSLSYGDQRLLDIILALARKPRLLLLDEPTSGLALAEIHTVVSKINDLSREITVLLIEHNMDVALNLADTVTVLHMGQIVTEGPPAMIRQDSRVKEVYLGTRRETKC
ncbi:MAG: ABC transporter ATP-binding protein [Thermodesulfobacteriota bacterium]